MSRMLSVACLVAACLLASASASSVIVRNNKLSLDEGMRERVTFELTEPIICDASNGRECSVYILLHNPSPKEVTMDTCVVRWTWRNWNKPQHVWVTAVEDFVDDREKTIEIVADAIESASEHYDGMEVPNIILTTKPRPSAVCRGTGDPHYTSFDGHYFHVFPSGKTVFYKSTVREFEVQTDMYSFNGRPAVHCSIAAKEGSDIVVINLCGDGFNIAFRRTCGTTECARGGFPKVGVTPGAYPRYTVDFKSGAQVSAHVHYWSAISRKYMNVYVTMPGKDRGHTEGLCGNSNGNRGDDVPVAYNGWIRNLAHLYSHQQVSASNDIYNYYPSGITDGDDEPELPPGSEICEFEETVVRPILNHPDVEDITNLIKKDTDNADTPGGAHFGQDDNEDAPDVDMLTARAVCGNRIEALRLTQACMDVLEGFDLGEFLDGCAEDLVATKGDVAFIDDAINALLDECADEGNRDQNTWEKDNDGNPIEPNKDLQDAMCPNECSGNGECKGAKCVCDSHFVGDDCSIDTREAPSVVELSHYFCDSNTHCETVAVVGSNIYNSDKLKCRVGEELTQAFFLGSTEVLCTLPHVDHAGADELNLPIAITTDGEQWSDVSDKATFTLYDKRCQVCDLTDGCRPNPTSCVIDGVCRREREVKDDNPCLKCLADKDSSAWSYDYSNHVECGPKFPSSTVEAKIVGTHEAGEEVAVVQAFNDYVKDDTSNKFTYSISTAAEHSFQIDPSTGSVSPTVNIDVNSLPLHFNNVLLIRVEDENGNSDETTLFIDMRKTNEDPLFEKSEYEFTVGEDVSVGFVIDTVAAIDTDDDEWGQVEYSWFLEEIGFEGTFAVEPTTGKISVAKPLDFETKSHFLLQLLARDGGGQLHTTVIEINVEDRNDAPTDISLSSASVAEGEDAGVEIGSLSTEDQDANSEFTYTIVFGDDNVALEGDKLVTKKVFNFETGPESFDVEIKSTDNGNPAKSITKTFTITVEDVNEKPYDVTLDSTKFPEDAKVGSILAQISVKDDDKDQQHFCSLAKADGVFDVRANQLVLVKPLDFETIPSIDITVVCVDSAEEPLQSDPTTFTITVENANDVPVVTFAADSESVAESAALGTKVGTVTAVDPDTESQDMTFSLEDPEETPFSLDQSTVACETLQDGRRSCTIDVLVNKALDFETQPVPEFVVSVLDDKDMYAVATFTVTVGDDNDPPTGLSWSQGGSVVENASPGTLVGQIKVDDQDAAPSYSFEIVEGKDMFTLNDRQARDLTGAVTSIYVAQGAKLDYESTGGSVALKLKATDGATGTSYELGTTVTISNEPISVVFDNGDTFVEIAEDFRVGRSVGRIELKGNDGAQPDVSLHFDDDGKFSLYKAANTYRLMLEKPLNYEEDQIQKVVVAVTPEGESEPALFDLFVRVTDVDEAPVFSVSSPHSINIYEHAPRGTTVFELEATDEDGDAIKYKLNSDATRVLYLDVLENSLRLKETIPSRVRRNTPLNAVVHATANGKTARLILKVTIQDDCSYNDQPCGEEGTCADAEFTFVCTCNNGYTGERCQTVSKSSGAAAMSSGATAGIVVGVLAAIILVAIVIFLVMGYRSKQDDDSKPFGDDAQMSINPTFVSSDKAVAVDMSGELVPGMANPIYDWYAPDMSRGDATEQLSTAMPGAFVVRDSKATPGWHMLGVRTDKAVLHEKIRMTDDGLYELLPSSNEPQPRFEDLPSLIAHYSQNRDGVDFVLAPPSSMSNPMYGQMSAPSGPAFWASDAHAPSLPLKQSQRDAVAMVAGVDDIYANKQEAKAALASSA